MSKYTLDAHSRRGGQLYFYGETMKSVLEKFDAQCHRSAWRIHIEDENGIIVKIIRNTFRKDGDHIIHNGFKDYNAFETGV